MKRTVVGILLAGILVAGASARAADCSYCAEVDALKKGFSTLKPDSQNEKEIDKELKLLDETEKLASRVLGARAEPAQSDWENILGLLAVAAGFDNDNTLAEDVSAAICPNEGLSCARLDKLHQEINRQKAAGLLTAKQANALQTAYGIAENTREHGTDEPAPKKNR